MNTEYIIAIIGGVLVIAEVVVRITPSEKDNSIVNKVKTVFDLLFPNKKVSSDETGRKVRNRETFN